MPPAPAPVSGTPKPGRSRRGWGPAAAILAIVAAVISAPAALDALIPEPSVERVGFYERVTFQGSGEQTGTQASLILPAGWERLSTPDPGILTVSNGAAHLTLTFHGGVRDPGTLLRASLPAGAALLPHADLIIDSPLDVQAVEYDLAAGDAPALDIALCPAPQPADRERSCLLVEATFIPASGADADDPGREDARRALSRMLTSLEIVPA